MTQVITFVPKLFPFGPIKVGGHSYSKTIALAIVAQSFEPRLASNDNSPEGKVA